MLLIEGENEKGILLLAHYDSRGQYGTAYMFETSKNNEKVIELYKKAKLPVTYSLATAVYSVMPNFTDFTPFVDLNLPGMNFAVLAGLDYYHSSIDEYKNIDLSSIQHFGTQIEPVIREFIRIVNMSKMITLKLKMIKIFSQFSQTSLFHTRKQSQLF